MLRVDVSVLASCSAAGQGTNSPMTAIGVVVVVTAVTVVTVAGPTFIIHKRRFSATHYNQTAHRECECVFTLLITHDTEPNSIHR